MNKVIFLDRDGVINQDSPDYIKTPEEWCAVPGSLEAIAQLKKAGFLVFVITNQSGISRGLFSLETLERIHQKFKNELNKLGAKIDGIFYCPHHPDEHCVCRKPEPGLLHQAAKQFNIDLRQAIFVGDSLKDLQAAQAVGAKAVLVKTGKGTATLKNLSLSDVAVFENLSVAVANILSRNTL